MFWDIDSRRDRTAKEFSRADEGCREEREERAVDSVGERLVIGRFWSGGREVGRGGKNGVEAGGRRRDSQAWRSVRRLA